MPTTRNRLFNRTHTALCLLVFAACNNSIAGEFSYRGNVSAEIGHFTANDPQNLDAQTNPAIYSSIELVRDFDDTNILLTAAPFFRFDSEDSSRTHADFRELKFSNYDDNWDIQLGLVKVFWGVAESRNIVNIVNQTDALEGVTSNESLGQPMMHVTHFFDWGNLELLAMPYFRERSFTGTKGRPKPPLPINADTSTYQSNLEHRHLDLAFRYTHSIDVWDFGLSYFNGTGREPLLKPNAQFTELSPHYYLLKQGGIDIQATIDAWLLKTELAYQTSSAIKDHLKLVTGFEYSFYDIKESGLDIGLVAEFLYDGLGETGFNIFQNDLLSGLRFALNDEQSTEALLAFSYDLDDSSNFFTAEFSRRIGSSFKFTAEAASLDNEEYIATTLDWFF